MLSFLEWAVCRDSVLHAIVSELFHCFLPCQWGQASLLDIQQLFVILPMEPLKYFPLRRETVWEVLIFVIRLPPDLHSSRNHII